MRKEEGRQGRKIGEGRGGEEEMERKERGNGREEGNSGMDSNRKGARALTQQLVQQIISEAFVTALAILALLVCSLLSAMSGSQHALQAQFLLRTNHPSLALPHPRPTLQNSDYP